MLIARFHAALSGGVPTAIHLLPPGKFKATDGRVFNNADPAAVVAATMAAGRPLTIDENHGTDYAAKAGFSAPACGRITSVEAREDGIWGNVEWNKAGLAMLDEKSYDGVSATISHTTDGTVTRILRASLTNDPAVAGLTALFQTQETTIMELAALRAALGLPDTADEAACLEAARSAVQGRTHLATFAAAAGVASTSTADQIVAAIRGGSTQMATLAAQVTATQAELTQLRTATLQAEATAVIDGAIKEGVPLLPVRDFYIKLYQTDPVGVKATLAALPRLNGRGAVNPAPADPTDPVATLSAIDLDVARKMGTDPIKLVAFRKKQAEAQGDGRAA